ncbi:MAG: DUF969 domain-containing protein [Verrucomicrobia bacterium]|nr:DUF969 domain-containing protein [Verrucomicrobiota bacterium]
MIKLVGILVVAVGFACRLNTLLVVLAAGIATGLVAGMSFNEIMALFGQFFVDNRFMTLPVVLMLPVVGLLERHGMKERVAKLIQSSRAATSGRVLLLYHALRGGTSTVGLNIGNHASMVRPLVAPMAEGAALAKHGPLAPAQVASIRAHAAAAENLGNFFADDIIVAVGPVLLIKGLYDSAGVTASVWSIALWGAPTAVFVLGVGWWRYRVLDRRLAAPNGKTR